LIIHYVVVKMDILMTVVHLHVKNVRFSVKLVKVLVKNASNVLNKLDMVLYVIVKIITMILI